MPALAEAQPRATFARPGPDHHWSIQTGLKACRRNRALAGADEGFTRTCRKPSSVVTLQWWSTSRADRRDLAPVVSEVNGLHRGPQRTSCNQRRGSSWSGRCREARRPSSATPSVPAGTVVHRPALSWPELVSMRDSGCRCRCLTVVTQPDRVGLGTLTSANTDRPAGVARQGATSNLRLSMPDHADVVR